MLSRPLTRRDAVQILVASVPSILFLVLINVWSRVGLDRQSGVEVMEISLRTTFGAFVLLPSLLGYGAIFRRWTGGGRDAPPLQACLGLATSLSLIHALGVFGLLSRAWIAWGVVVVGVALWVYMARCQWRKSSTTSELNSSPNSKPFPFNVATFTFCALFLLATVAVSLLAVASSSPPGWLWDSEARGYDTLSYHLQLPQEWIAAGRIWPVEHNVYSFLPSYMEAAYTHLGILASARPPAPGSGDWGLVASDGVGLVSAQILHACVALLAAYAIAWMVRALGSEAGLWSSAADDTDDVRDTMPATFWLACALALAVPWVLVVGSSAYNEMPVIALTAGAVIAASSRNIRPVIRAILAGLLVGVACGCKPTALFLAGPVVGVLLLGLAPVRAWPGMILAGSIAGLLTLAPWLIRNAIATGNPVFPFAPDLLGHGHWSAEQLARYARGHHESAGLIERLRLMVLPDATDPAGVVHRGLMHPQWSIFFPAVLVAGLALLAAPRVRSEHCSLRWISGLLGLGLVITLLAWLTLTHIQSRFLMPLIVPGVAIIALAAAAWSTRARLVMLAPLALVAVLAAHSAGTFLAQPVYPVRGQPNAFAAAGVGVRTGETFRAELARGPSSKRDAILADMGPEAYANTMLPPGSKLYLLGDATPLYFSLPVVYNTTWDRWPIAEAIRAHPGEAARWTAQLRAAGITHVLINLAELARLQRSGWIDPDITPERITAWAGVAGRVLRQWEDRGTVLIELAPPSAAAPNPTSTTPTTPSTPPAQSR